MEKLNDINSEFSENNGPHVLLATVKGDIHDIGKNLVSMMLQNNGFVVSDLGKDVSCEDILQTLSSESVDIVGLSALMTTTASNMEKTVKRLKQTYPNCPVLVGGAVITDEFARRIGADGYADDAQGAVREAKRLQGLNT